MKKIDLHMHTQKCKQGDGNGRKISVDSFIEKMNENNIGVCAITNHNKFDINEFDEIRQKSPDLVIFPGIELDVEFFDGETKHIILICDPVCKMEFYCEFSDEENRNYNEYKLIYDDFITKIKKFKENEMIIIPHFLDKDKKRALNITDKNKFKEDLAKYVVILETSKLQSMGMINAHNEVSLMGSDIKNWGNYGEEAKLLPELKFSIDSFGKFYELASDSKLFIKTALNGCTKFKINSDLECKNDIELYEDVNVIFGEKGSGKTVLLKNEIYPELQKMGKKTFLHEGKNYQKAYDEILNNVENSIDIDNDIKSRIIGSLNTIFEYREQAKDNFIDKYIKYYDNETKNKNAKFIKKTEVIYNKTISDTTNSIIQDINVKFANIEKTEYINMEIREDNNPNRKLLSDELSKLKIEIKEQAILKCREKFVADKTDIILECLKSTLDKKTGKKSKPNNIGFSRLVKERQKYFEINKMILDDFESIQIRKTVKLGELPNKGEICAEISIKVLEKDEKHVKGSPFDRNKISSNRDIVKKINEFSFKHFSEINKYFTNEERERKGLEYFDECIKKVCKVVRSNGEIYEPSEGEKSILSISGVIENNTYDCYLFDEIERGLGNKYISEYIIPHIKRLRDRGKTVVLSTHNANIAVSTLPSQTIYCNYIGDNKAEIYYIGNMYSNELVSIKNENNIIAWEEKALKHLEGSKEMFSIRRNIWNLKK